MADLLRLRAELQLGSTQVLAGAVLRPPQLIWDGMRYCGSKLRAVSANSLAGVPGVVQLVVERDFVGIVAQDAPYAHAALARLQLQWDEPMDKSKVGRQQSAPLGSHATEAGTSSTYRWPGAEFRLGQSTSAVAWHHDDSLTVWAACANAQALREELAALLGLPAGRVDVRASSAPPSPFALDAAADAALLSKAVGRPVQVEATAPSQAAPALVTFELRALRGLNGHISRLELACDGRLAARPSLAHLLSEGMVTSSVSAAANLSYSFEEHRAVFSKLMPLRPAQTLAGEVFATESFLDELAHATGDDPISLRLAHMEDSRGAALVRSVRDQAALRPERGADSPGTRHGRGFAYASAPDETDPATRIWSAWVMDVAVDSAGHVDIERVVVGHDAELLHPMAAGSPAIEGQVREAAARLLQAPKFDDWSTAQARHLPAAGELVPFVEVVGPGSAIAPAGALGWQPAATLPAAAALANAIFDATGVRLREPPFSGPQLQMKLSDSTAARPSRRLSTLIGGFAALAAALVVTVVPWRAEIAPTSGPQSGLYNEATLERGRLVAAAGDCVVCHTAPGRITNTGGLALDTPFGTIYSTNITPDMRTGIGAWSFAAFERAMRQGMHRDGSRLYPAFPYTAYAKITDADMQALYAYLMSQPAVESEPPKTRLAFPFNIRGLLGGWNLLFHDDKPFQPDSARPVEWNRGAYLVQGLGHCGACHTPRNALGAERRGAESFLAGGFAEGWEAPALNGLSRAPLPWTVVDLYAYLRTGVSARHGVAAGPMAPVIHELGQLPDSDIWAIATYIGSLKPSPPTEEELRSSLQALDARAAAGPSIPRLGVSIFEGACAACHAPGGPTLFGSKVALGLSTNLHSERPDNLVRVILQGIENPAYSNLGYMPGFADSLDDQQVEALVRYLRERFGDGKPSWKDLGKTIGRVRAEQEHANKQSHSQ